MRKSRITRGDEYKNVFRTGIRVGGQNIVTHAVLSSQEDVTRYGFVVSKAVGNAVKRNLIKRRLKGITHELPLREGLGVDFVFRAKPNIANISFKEMHDEVNSQVLKAYDRIS